MDPDHSNTTNFDSPIPQIRKLVEERNIANYDDALLSILSNTATLCPSMDDKLSDQLHIMWKLIRSENEVSNDLRSNQLHCDLGLVGDVLKLGLERDELTPFEIHAIAVQAIVFSEVENTTYVCICLMVCSYALNLCPVPIRSRPKRWRSCQLETIRLFQRRCLATTNVNNEEEENDGGQRATILDTEVPIRLWVDYILPACERVQSSLQAHSALQSAAYSSALMGTASRLVEQTIGCDLGPPSHENNSLVAELWVTVKSTVTVDELKSYSLSLRTSKEAILLKHTPATWSRDQALTFYRGDDVELESGDIADFMQESVAHVDTAWQHIGTTLMVAGAFLNDDVLEIDNPWDFLCPFLDTLLVSEYKSVNHFGYSLLSRLSTVIPGKSLSLSENLSAIGTLQLLANRIVVAASLKRMEAKQAGALVRVWPDGPQTFSMMKTLLSKFGCHDQAKIVHQLLDACPHVGLKPKLVDLLRSFISWTDHNDIDRVWLVVETCLVKLLEQSKEVDAGSWIDTEMHLSALSLIEVWIRYKGTVPAILHRYKDDLRQVQTLCKKNDDHGVGLLESTISNLLDMS